LGGRRGENAVNTVGVLWPKRQEHTMGGAGRVREETKQEAKSHE